ncbi:MAG: DNA polymerase III subunit delta [Clostridia bacterium]|nr:DNA polymerase III subunit delta [Clostridia bacterium]
MLVNELKTKLKSGKPEGWYIFCGEENFLKRHYLGELRAAILTEPAFDAFNHLVMEGEKVDYGAIADAVKAPPMMAERKLVEWHLGDFSAMREGDLEKLHALREEGKDYPETTVCFLVDAERLDVGNLPKRPSKLYTALSKDFSIVCFEKSTEAALATWLDRHFKHEGINASPAVIRALLAQSGTGMDALSGEVTKLCCYLKANGRDTLTEEDVALVASRVTESDAFGLSNAILAGNADAAYACLRDMKLRKVEPAMAVSSVARIYSDLLTVAEFAAEGTPPAEIAAHMKMHEYKLSLYLKAAQGRGIDRLRAALSLCRRADIAAKTGAGADGYLSLELLIARTL